MSSLKALGLIILFLLIFFGCTREKGSERALSSSIDFSDEKQLNSPWIRGIYADRWIGDRADIALANPSHVRVMEIAGSNVDDKSDQQDLDITVSSSGRDFYVLKVPALGDFREYVPLPLDIAEKDTLHFSLLPSKSFVPSAIGTSNDDRTLSFRIGRISLVSGVEADSLFPESFEFPRAAETDRNLEGLYKDGWMEDLARVTLYNTTNRANLEIKGYYPTGVFSKIADLEVGVGGKLLVKEQLSRKNRGYFRIVLQLPEQEAMSSKVQITLKPSGSFVPSERGINPDTRRISYRLEYIGLK